MHLDEEKVQRILHRELVPSDEAPLREHLSGCAECRSRVAGAARAEQEVFALLRQLDHAAPRVDARAVAARATETASSRDSRWVRRAAIVVLLLGAAGVAYAAPGSPLPAWIDTAVRWIEGGERAPQMPGGGLRDRDAGGIAVDPGRNLVILFTSAQPQGEARVSLTDGNEVVVRALSGAAAFTSDMGRLVIDNRRSAASYEIQIPRAAAHVEIRVGTDRVFLKAGPRTTAPGAQRASGAFILSLAGSGL